MIDKEDEQTRLLREILKWIKFAGMREVKGILLSTLNTDQKKIVYQLSDGSKGIVEIGRSSGISSSGTISRYWKSWSKLNLGDFIAVRGGDRFKRAFDLEDLGIEVPESVESKPKEVSDQEAAKGEHAEEKTEAKHE
jgi:hypothetical protein